MKKFIVGAFILAVATFSAQAQETERKTEESRNGHRKEAFHQLNLSEEQKAKFKSAKEDFRKQMQELEKNDNITVKEWKAKKETLEKDHHAQMQQLLTAEQKALLEKRKGEHRSGQRGSHEAKRGKMKTNLGLSTEQAEKMKKSRTEMAEKMKALRENKSLSEEQRKEQLKELRNEQKKSLESILTADQLKKLHDKRRPAKQPM